MRESNKIKGFTFPTLEGVNTLYPLLICNPLNASYRDCVRDIDEQERIDAVSRHLKGDKSVDICKDANRSKKWLIGWVNRFKTGEEEWYKSQSRAPQQHGRKTNEEIESVIVNIRKALMEGNEHESKYLSVGADTIQYRMNKLGCSDDEIPSASTIKTNCEGTWSESE